jgi:GT2 family glycosyltransferase
MDKKIAVLLTSHNRKNKTIACLQSLYQANLTEGYQFDVFLVDDGSTDGTTEAIEKSFTNVNILQGTGNLFWAGGMRLAWKTAIEYDKYNVYLMINDDVVLKKDIFINFIATDTYVIKTTNKSGVYSACTVEEKTGKPTYGGTRILKSGILLKTERVFYATLPQKCDMTNANILWVSSSVVDKIGILDEHFTHGIADYDYALRAKKEGFPVYVAQGIGGYCSDDHAPMWKSSKNSLKERIRYLKSPLGLQYKEYLFYLRRHFPLSYPYTFLMLWLKTFFPFLWEKFKKR